MEHIIMERHFNVNFDQFMKRIQSGQTVNQMPQSEIDGIFELGVYYGIFNENNYGDYDRANTVSLFMSTLQGMIKYSSKEPVCALGNDSEAKNTTTFHVKINNGQEQTIETKSGVYKLAVATALAQLDYEHNEDGNNIVEIWVPHLLPDYGPYFYLHDGHQIHPYHK
jgi:hypothetical protein